MDEATLAYLMAEPGTADPAGPLAELLRRPAWQAQAACRGQGPRAYFSTAPGAVEAARAVCGQCPVRVPCGAYAREHDLEGLWAGATERERRAMRRGAA